jgi:hypothetical protein
MATRLDKIWHCGCGLFKTDWPASKAIHQLHCDEKPKATEGRIAARQRALVPVVRHAGGRPRKPRGDDHVDRTPPAIGTGAIVAAATNKAVEIVIAGLTAKRDAIDRAIAALS